MYKSLKINIYKTSKSLFHLGLWVILRAEHTQTMCDKKVLRIIFGTKREEVTGE
jgi:hypothetical protein